jgi:CheY-like chemotaxis protein
LCPAALLSCIGIIPTSPEKTLLACREEVLIMKKIILTDHFKHQLDPEFFEELENYEVITAYSNENALELHRSQKADLIITELYGSGLNGGQLCTLLREDELMRGVSVILYCRDNELEIEESLRSRGPMRS